MFCDPTWTLYRILAIFLIWIFSKKIHCFQQKKNVMEICEINFPEFGNSANFHTKKNKIKNAATYIPLESKYIFVVVKA